MRVAAEGGNYLVHFDRLLGSEFVTSPKMCRCLWKYFLCQCNRLIKPLQVIGTLTVCESASTADRWPKWH